MSLVVDETLSGTPLTDLLRGTRDELLARLDQRETILLRLQKERNTIEAARDQASAVYTRAIRQFRDKANEIDEQKMIMAAIKTALKGKTGRAQRVADTLTKMVRCTVCGRRVRAGGRYFQDSRDPTFTYCPKCRKSYALNRSVDWRRKART